MTNTRPSPDEFDQLFRKAIDMAGSECRLARAIGFSQNAVWTARRYGKTSAEMAAAIHRFTNGEVPRHALRPDLWEKPLPIID